MLCFGKEWSLKYNLYNQIEQKHQVIVSHQPKECAMKLKTLLLLQFQTILKT